MVGASEIPRLAKAARVLGRLDERLVLVRSAEETVVADQSSASDQLFKWKRKLVHVLQLQAFVAAIAIRKGASIRPARAMNI